MKLANLQEARYHGGVHPVIDFINDVADNSIGSQRYPKDQEQAIIKAISNVWGRPHGRVHYSYFFPSSGIERVYVYWTREVNENYVKISLSHNDASHNLHVVVSKS